MQGADRFPIPFVGTDAPPVHWRVDGTLEDSSSDGRSWSQEEADPRMTLVFYDGTTGKTLERTVTKGERVSISGSQEAHSYRYDYPELPEGEIPFIVQGLRTQVHFFDRTITHRHATIGYDSELEQFYVEEGGGSSGITFSERGDWIQKEKPPVEGIPLRLPLTEGVTVRLMSEALAWLADRDSSRGGRSADLRDSSITVRSVEGVPVRDPAQSLGGTAETELYRPSGFDETEYDRSSGSDSGDVVEAVATDSARPLYEPPNLAVGNAIARARGAVLAACKSASTEVGSRVSRYGSERPRE